MYLVILSYNGYIPWCPQIHIYFDNELWASLLYTCRCSESTPMYILIYMTMNIYLLILVYFYIHVDVMHLPQRAFNQYRMPISSMYVDWIYLHCFTLQCIDMFLLCYIVCQRFDFIYNYVSRYLCFHVI